MPQTSGFKPLPLNAVKQVPHLPQTVHHASASDPALPLLSDLRQGPCVIARHSDSLGQALYLMLRAGVRMVFVAGVDGELVGMATADDVQGERAVLRAATNHVPHQELTLDDVMLPIAQWHTVDLNDIRHARLGDVAATLHEHGLRYLLVTETKQGDTTLCGLFSARRLEMILHTAIEPDLHSRSFAELGQALGR